MNANDNAFPMERLGPNDTEQHGLTKREYFAVMAMQGLFAHYGTHTSIYEAVAHADRLIAELSTPR